MDTLTFGEYCFFEFNAKDNTCFWKDRGQMVRKPKKKNERQEKPRCCATEIPSGEERGRQENERHRVYHVLCKINQT
jgi:hypothetical protein